MTSSLIACVAMVMIGASSVVAQSNVQCYLCDYYSSETPQCDDPFRSISSPAPANAYCNGTYCSKTSINILGVVFLTRGCQTGPVPTSNCQFSSGIVNCTCAGNLCNAATPSAASSSTVMTLAAATGIALFIATRQTPLAKVHNIVN